MIEVGWAAASAVLHLSVVSTLLLPPIWWRARRQGRAVTYPGGARVLTAAAGMYVAAYSTLSLPQLRVFADLNWAWQNKLLLLALLLLTVWLWPTLNWQSIGVRRPRPGWWIPVLAAFTVMLGVNLLGGPPVAPSAETVVFQALVPGLDEEFLFRGVLLLLLHRALTGRRTLWRASAGWEVPITCVLFGLSHGLEVGNGWQVTFQPGPVIVAFLLGLLFVWIRIRWASIWPAILAHNAVNTAAVMANVL